MICFVLLIVKEQITPILCFFLSSPSWHDYCSLTTNNNHQSLALYTMPPANQKQKAPEELSTNPHTTKVRNWKASLSAVQWQVENAAAADHQACHQAIDKIKGSAEYAGKSEDKKHEMEETATHTMMEKQYVPIYTHNNQHDNHNNKYIGTTSTKLPPNWRNILDMVREHWQLNLMTVTRIGLKWRRRTRRF